MANESQLASLYIDLATRNSKQVDKEIDAKRVKLAQAAAAASAYGKIATGALSAVGRAATVAGAAITGIVFKGMSGTQEAGTLSNAFQLLATVVADIAAPAIRAFTQVIIEIAAWLLTLDGETRDNILSWTLFATGIAGATAAFVALLPAVRAIVNVSGLLLSKWALIPAAIGGVAVALVYATGEGDTFVDRMLSGLEKIREKWHELQQGLTFVAVAAYTGSIDQGYDAANQLRNEQFAERKKQTEDLKKRAEDLKKILGQISGDSGSGGIFSGIKGVFGSFAGIKLPGLGDLFGGEAWDRIMKVYGDKTPLKVQHEFNIQSLQQSWERLQKTKTGGDEQDKQIGILDQIRRGIDKLVNKRHPAVVQ